MKIIDENFLRTPLSEAHKCDERVSRLHFLLWSKSNPKHKSTVRRSTVNSLWLATTTILVLI